MKTAMKILVAAAAIVGGAATANAATYNEGTLGDGTYVWSYGVWPGAFTDDLKFTVSSTSSVAGAAGNLPVSLTFGSLTEKILNISGLTIGLWNVTTSSAVPTTSVGGSILASNLVPTDEYEFVVSGTADGGLGGWYGVGAKIGAVPLPGAVLLFGTGLAGLGLAARRRKAVAAV